MYKLIETLIAEAFVDKIHDANCTYTRSGDFWDVVMENKMAGKYANYDTATIAKQHAIDMKDAIIELCGIVDYTAGNPDDNPYAVPEVVMSLASIISVHLRLTISKYIISRAIFNTKYAIFVQGIVENSYQTKDFNTILDYVEDKYMESVYFDSIIGKRRVRTEYMHTFFDAVTLFQTAYDKYRKFKSSKYMGNDTNVGIASTVEDTTAKEQSLELEQFLKDAGFIIRLNS